MSLFPLSLSLSMVLSWLASNSHCTRSCRHQCSFKLTTSCVNINVYRLSNLFTLSTGNTNHWCVLYPVDSHSRPRDLSFDCISHEGRPGSFTDFDAGLSGLGNVRMLLWYCAETLPLWWVSFDGQYAVVLGDSCKVHNRRSYLSILCHSIRLYNSQLRCNRRLLPKGARPLT